MEVSPFSIPCLTFSILLCSGACEFVFILLANPLQTLFVYVYLPYPGVNSIKLLQV